MITYTTPSGSENIEFTLIAHRGVVWALTVTPKAKNSTNLEHQKAFAQAISTEVIGKRIRDLHLTVIGGASLETGAFNQFITQL